MKIKAIIIDDQEEVIMILESLLKENCKDVELIAAITDPSKAMELINSTNPDLIFLDIKMPGISGFDLLKTCNKNFDVVIISSHKEFGPEAYSNGALHYLLKPIDQEKLIEAVERVMEKKALMDSDVLIAQGRIRIPDPEGFYVIPISDIIRFEADGNYTTVFTKDGRYKTTKTLGIYEVKLKPYDFIRVHHKSLINNQHITRYIRGKTGIVVMSDKSEIEISRRKKEEFLKNI